MDTHAKKKKEENESVVKICQVRIRVFDFTHVHIDEIISQRTSRHTFNLFGNYVTLSLTNF